MNKALIIILLFSFSIKAQEIKVTEKKHITLLFESNIISGIVSNEDYIFEYNQDEPDNMALIKAKSKTAEETSLIIKTENGTIFNINVLYGISNKSIIQISDSLGVKAKTQTPHKELTLNKSGLKEKNESSENLKDSVKNSIRENDYTIGSIIINDSENKDIECLVCEKLLKSKKNIKRILDEKYNVKIQLNNIYYLDNKLYCVISFINESDSDYNLNYIKSYVETSNESKTSSTQYLEKDPILIFNSNRTIPVKSERKYIFVFEQFSIDNNKKLTFEVNENNGERNLFLKIPHFLINNPKNLKN